MSNKIDELKNLLAPAIDSLGGEVFLWGIEFVPGSRQSLLRVYIDAQGRPVTLDDCESVSREISALLDVSDPIAGNYNLEVSSPGLDRPLFEPEQFARFVGETIKVALVLPQNGRRRVTGPIVQADADAVRVADEAGEIDVAFGNIQKARIVPTFDVPEKAPRRKRKDAADDVASKESDSAEG